MEQLIELISYAGIGAAGGIILGLFAKFSAKKPKLKQK